MIKVSIYVPDPSTINASIQIWSMKKNEEAAAKRKPKTSAAQIRVQKGAHRVHLWRDGDFS
jgi:hypothetical protein